MRRINVVIADDHKLIRESLSLHIESLPYVKRVDQAENGKEVLRISREVVPDVILMDIQMPEMNGVECSEIMLKRFPNVKILALTAVENPKAIIHMIELGVQGYLLKNIDLDELDRAIVSVVENDFYQNQLVMNIMRHEIISQKFNIDPHYQLTERDKTILKLICQEKTSQEIAEEINRSPKTVELARTEIAKKLGVKGIVGIVRFAIKNGYDL